MWVALYVVSIVLVNWLFTAVAPWSTVLGDLYLANVVVGFVFVLRDYAQREIGHKILLATLLAGVVTYFMVDPVVASRQHYGFCACLKWPTGQSILSPGARCNRAF